MYRLMETAGVELLNATDVLTQPVYPFTTVDDIIAAREQNRGRNPSNNSTYLTISSKRIPQVYGKTYGASKKETTLLCIALSRITPTQIELYEISEGNLTELPKPDLDVIKMLGKVEIIPTDRKMERKLFKKDNSLRSPTFTYNLLRKLGRKECALCECEIPELIQGAHIWRVADIKRRGDLSEDDKLKHATDGDNGIWLCDNHHTMLDEDLLRIEPSGRLTVIPGLGKKSEEYISRTTPIMQLTPVIFTQGFATYLQSRYPP